MLKFIYSERATKFAKSSPYFWLQYIVKIKVNISQNVVAFSEYINLISILFAG